MSDIGRANAAKSILDSIAYQDAYKAVRQALLAGIEKCPLADTQTAEDFRRCLRLLGAVQGNMVAALNSGKLEAFRLQQKETASKNPFRNIFRDRQA
jgi:hypothetical protein